MKALETMFSVPIDDGIPEVLRPEFEDWINAVRKKVFEGHTSNSTDDAFMQGFLSAWMGPSFWNALASAEKQYQTYVMARDWWEFDHAQRVPAGFDKPETYGILLYTRFHHLPVQTAAANYKKMTELLGVQRVQAAAKRVMDAPKRGDGGLVVSVEATKKGPGGGGNDRLRQGGPADPIGAFADPVRVMEMLSTQDDDRRYLLDCCIATRPICESSIRQRRGRGPRPPISGSFWRSVNRNCSRRRARCARRRNGWPPVAS
jgi:hypothetical protein